MVLVRLTCRVEPIWGSVGHAGGQILLGPRGLCAAVAGLEGALPMAAARSHWRSIVLGSYACLAAYLPSYLARPALGARSLSGPWGRALSGPWGPPAHLGLGASRPLGPARPPFWGGRLSALSKRDARASGGGVRTDERTLIQLFE